MELLLILKNYKMKNTFSIFQPELFVGLDLDELFVS